MKQIKLIQWSIVWIVFNIKIVIHDNSVSVKKALKSNFVPEMSQQWVLKVAC